MIVSVYLIRFALLAWACLQLAHVSAEGFPVPGKPIRIVVPFPPGGTSDIHARHIASKLGPALGASVIVDNKPGASTIIGAMAVVNAEPDGHTLLYTLTLTVASTPYLFSKLPYAPVRDFTPITYASTAITVLVVSSSLPVSNVRELIEHARRNPGTLNFGSWSPGGAGQLNGELLKELTGIDIVHVAYKGCAELMQALASGQVQMAFDGLLTSRTLEKSGKARIIAVADDKRARAAPDVPTMAEAGAPGAYASGGYHFFGPANVPRPIIARLNTELIKVLRMQEINDMYTSTGMEVVASTPEEQVGILQSQSERLGSIIRKLGIKLD